MKHLTRSVLSLGLLFAACTAVKAQVTEKSTKEIDRERLRREIKESVLMEFDESRQEIAAEAMEEALEAVAESMRELRLELKEMKLELADLELDIEPLDLRLESLDIDLEPVEIDLSSLRELESIKDLESLRELESLKDFDIRMEDLDLDHLRIRTEEHGEERREKDLKKEDRKKGLVKIKGN